MRHAFLHDKLAWSPEAGYLHADVTDTFYAGDAFIGYGAQFEIGQGDGSPETFTALPQVKSITFGDMTTGVVDVTHLRSIGRHREKLATLRDSGPISVMCSYVPSNGAYLHDGGDGFDATHNALVLWETVAQNNFQIVMPAAAGSIVLPVRGTITKYQIGQLGIDAEVPITIEITPLSSYSEDWPDH